LTQYFSVPGLRDIPAENMSKIADALEEVSDALMIRYCRFCLYYIIYLFAFSSLTPLVGRQEGHPACKKTEWWGDGVVICLEQGADLPS